jgi:ADP-ribosylglycohydrolase
MLLGCAVGDALSLHRAGMHPRVAIKIFGRNPLQYRFQPGVGVTSDITHGLIITIQSMLRSRTDKNRFAYQLGSRLAWYQRSHPGRYLAHMIGRSGIRFRKGQHDDSLSIGIADDPLVRCIPVAIMLQGSTDSLSRWFQQCVEVSHADPKALHASVLIGHAAQIAQVAELEHFDSLEAMNMLIESTDDVELIDQLQKLHDFLADGKSVSYVARMLGYENGVPSNLYAIASIAVYAWLRHARSFRKAVEKSVLLGGCCGDVAAIVGALSGILLGKQAIPEAWLQSLTLYPYGNQWKEELIDRIKDWPHGVEDIQQAKSAPSMIGGQIIRNCSNGMFRLLHAGIRFPITLTQFSIGKRRSRRTSR